MYSRVYVEITNICNMNCSFCHGHSRQLRMMSTEEFALILDKIKDHTKYIYYHLMGEPLLHPDLPVFLKMAKDIGFRSMLTTNGTLLKKRGDEIIAAGLHKVNISLHSFEGDDAAQYENYMSELVDFAQKASESGIIVVFRLWNNGFDGGKNDVVLKYLSSRLTGEWTENTKGLRIRNKMFLEYGERFGWPDKNAQVQGKEFFCHGLRDHFGILCDGTVVPCCLDSDGVINLGNIFENDADIILSSPRVKAIVQAFDGRKATEELCRRCAYAQRFV